MTRLSVQIVLITGVVFGSLVFGNVAIGGVVFDTQSDRQQPRRFVERIPGTEITFDMVHVPAGSFLLGSADDEPGAEEDERPQRRFTMTAFWIGAYEVTHDEYAVFRYRRLDSDSTAVPGQRFDVDAITRPSPPYEDPAHGMGLGKNPATGMTQWAALQYARWLSLKTGRLYRLPTEVEWEYACRAGRVDRAGDTQPTLDNVAWYVSNSEGRFHPVGTKSPNALGVHDMLGNVAEWTLDQYDDSFYERIADSPGVLWNKPTQAHPRTVRGGSYRDELGAIRCADRVASTLRWKRRDPQLPQSVWWNTDSPHVGFRLVSPDGELTPAEIRAYWAELLPGS